MSKKPISSLTILIPYIKRYRLRLAGIFALIVVVIAIDLSQPIIIKEAIDRYISISHPDFNSISLMSGIYLGVVILAFFLTYYQDILLQSTGQFIIRDIRTSLFKHILGLSVNYFDRTSSGRIITNVVSDTEALNNFFTEFLANTLRGALTLIIIIVFMFQLDVRFAFYCITVVPLILIISRYFQGKLRVINQEMRSRLATLIAFLAENLAGMSIVQIFHQEAKQFREFDEKNNHLLKSMLTENQMMLLFFLFTEALSDLGVAALVWFGSGSVIRGDVTFGVLFAFIGFIRRFFQPINTITMQLNALQSMIIASERIGQTLVEQPDIIEATDAKKPALIQGGVRFDSVQLAYRANHNVLKGISLEIQPGDRVGFVGSSGAGKTSLMNLLARFYDCTQGTIYIDGQRIDQWPLKELRNTIGIVQQDITLFGGSVLENIRFFKQEIPRERVIEVCTLIGADAFIRRLPDGYDSTLSEKGSTLSFGERQLLSFARVIVSDPRILILDEATASLDSETEAVLQNAIAKISASRTLLVVAHRLSTVQMMDYIVVLDHGLIVEKGNHDTLMALQGHYYKLYLSGNLSDQSIKESVQSLPFIPQLLATGTR